MDVGTARLQRGRVWHVSAGREYVGPDTDTTEVSWCGEDLGATHGERLGAQIPHGGRICWRCVVAVNDYRKTVLGVALTDRRPEIVDAWPKLLDQHADDDVVAADEDPYCGECGHLLDRHGPTSGCREHDDTDPLDGPCLCDRVG